MASSTQAQPSPILIFRTLRAFENSAALKTAIELDLFTAVGEGSNTAASLARRVKVAERGARILADHLVVLGFLTKKNGSYGLTEDSATFLDRRSPAYMGTVAKFLAAPHAYKNFEGLTDAVRRGGAPEDAHSVTPDDDMWVEFARSMAPLMVPASQFIADLTKSAAARPMKVLDIAAGHGLFGIAVAKANPKAEIVAVDWKPVLSVAQENANKAGVANRYRALYGSAFDVDFGSGYDLVLLTNFLHHFDVPTNEKLLRKIHAALNPGGRVATLEFVPNDDRVTPPDAAAFAIIMLASTPHGDAFTRKELESMLRNAGFRSTEMHMLPTGFQAVLLSQK